MPCGCVLCALQGLAYGEPGERPEAANLLTIYQLVSGLSRDAVAQQAGSPGFARTR